MCAAHSAHCGKPKSFDFFTPTLHSFAAHLTESAHTSSFGRTPPTYHAGVVLALVQQLCPREMSLQQWIGDQLSILLGFDSSEIATYLSSLPPADARAYVTNLLGTGPEANQFLSELAKRQRSTPAAPAAAAPAARDGTGGSRNTRGGSQSQSQQQPRIPPESTARGGAGAVSSTIASSSAATRPALTSTAPVFTPSAVSAAPRVTHAFTPAPRHAPPPTPVAVPGPLCNCYATRHPLFCNCTGCGKVLCCLEAGTGCNFCGAALRLANGVPVDAAQVTRAHASLPDSAASLAAAKAAAVAASTASRAPPSHAAFPALGGGAPAAGGTIGGIAAENNGGAVQQQRQSCDPLLDARDDDDGGDAASLAAAATLDPAGSSARSHLNKLLSYDRSSAARTHVVDDAVDSFHDARSGWLTPEERAAAQADAAHKAAAAAHRPRGMRIALEFGGGVGGGEGGGGDGVQVVDEELVEEQTLTRGLVAHVAAGSPSLQLRTGAAAPGPTAAAAALARTALRLQGGSGGPVTPTADGGGGGGAPRTFENHTLSGRAEEVYAYMMAEAARAKRQVAPASSVTAPTLPVGGRGAGGTLHVVPLVGK